MKLNVKKTMLTLLLTGSLALNRSGVLAKSETDFDKGDYVRSMVSLNMRIHDNIEAKKIALIKENEIVYRIISYDNGWDLVLYNNMLGFVYRDYLEEMNIYDDKVEHFKVSDIIEFDSKVNFRLEPSLDGKRITSINKGELADVIAKTDNNWYLISYNGTIGYVCGDYVTSLLDRVKMMYPKFSISEFNLSKIVYATSSLNVRSGNGIEYQKIGFLNKYESVRVLGEYNDWYLILNNNNLLGFVDKRYTKEIEDTFVIIDLSEQQLWLYDNNNLILTTLVVTGKDTTPTRIGLFKIKNKERDRYLIGEDYQSFVKYWMPFDGGIGLHDASWRKKFGGTIYQKNGSHGCVNMPSSVTDDIYETVSVGTKVLVHK